MSDLLDEIRAVFNGNYVPGKNILLRRAHDEITRLRGGIKRLSDEEELLAETTDGDEFTLVSIAAKLAAAEAAILAGARKAEAMKQEIAELREALRPFAAVEPVSISTSDGHISSDAFRRARTLLNGGPDAHD